MFFLIKLLIRRKVFRKRYHWSVKKIKYHQQEQFNKLRSFATQRSSFYQKLYKGLENKPLNELPVITKAILMESFDEVATDNAVKKSGIEDYLLNSDGKQLYLDKYRIAKTSGSTGQPGIFIYDKDEWLTVVTSYSRANDFSKIKADLFHSLKLAVVSSRVPWHQSALVGKTLESPIVPALRIDATESISQINKELNEFQPRLLVAYASMARLLAEEQLSGRLQIHPEAVMTASEVLTKNTALLITEAWGKKPFNVYAATESAGIASECVMHNGMHMYEDLVITEIVDSNNRPVPVGEFGEKILVTVLFSRTLPLIRYEISDSIKLSQSKCPCGKEYKLIDTVQGRIEDILKMRDVNNNIQVVHPNVFHQVFDRISVREWLYFHSLIKPTWGKSN